MDTKMMEKLYHQVANLLNNMIPEEWVKVLSYAEMSDEGGEVFFYYYPEDRNDPVYIHNIANVFEIDEDQFEKSEDELYLCFRELREEFKRNQQTPWTNVTFLLENTGAFSLDYGYQNISESNPLANQVVWEYKYLGRIPQDDWKKTMLDDYLKNQDQPQ